jgi:hypothetical protein
LCPGVPGAVLSISQALAQSASQGYSTWGARDNLARPPLGDGMRINAEVSRPCRLVVAVRRPRQRHQAHHSGRGLIGRPRPRSRLPTHSASSGVICNGSCRPSFFRPTVWSRSPGRASCGHLTGSRRMPGAREATPAGVFDSTLGTSPERNEAGAGTSRPAADLVREGRSSGRPAFAKLSLAPQRERRV